MGFRESISLFIFFGVLSGTNPLMKNLYKRQLFIMFISKILMTY